MHPQLKGKKFNKLTVLEFSHVSQKREACWKCQCECGNVCIATTTDLRKGHKKSCGCLKNEKSYRNSYKHGLSKTPLYSIWLSMKDRCLNENNKYFNNYGSRGITVCDEWKDDFMNFYNWAIANGYSDNLSIDRIDVNGNYEPSNCRWATKKEQQNNKRDNVLITYKGKTKTLQEWADETGISRNTLMKRKRSGWNDEDIVSKPVNKKFSTKRYSL